MKNDSAPSAQTLRARVSRPPGGPVGRILLQTDSYAEAERAVNYLSDRDFPVERTAIIGRDLVLFEKITGRLDYPRAALRGAGSGAIPGALIGWIFGLFDWVDPLLAALWLALWGAIFGAVIGALFGVATHYFNRGTRDFSSFEIMQPTRYEVVADPDVADEAASILAQAGLLERDA